MGTNYYAMLPKENLNKKYQIFFSNLPTSVYDEDTLENISINVDELLSLTRIHLGKNSCGWKFALASPNNIFKSFEHMLSFLRNDEYKIINEYGEEFSIEYFENFVRESWKNESNKVPVITIYPESSFYDDSGYLLCTVEFC